MNAVVAGELYLGASLRTNATENDRRVAAFLASPTMRILPVGADTAR